jgi:hypothetical protein
MSHSCFHYQNKTKVDSLFCEQKMHFNLMKNSKRKPPNSEKEKEEKKKGKEKEKTLSLSLSLSSLLSFQTN